MAEKQRRDNLNTNISAMAALVPIIAESPRKMDKISILRLTAAFLRTHYTLGRSSIDFLPRELGDLDLEQYIVDNLIESGGFFIVVTTSGKIVYVSRQVNAHLGYTQTHLERFTLFINRASFVVLFVASGACGKCQREKLQQVPDERKQKASHTMVTMEVSFSSLDEGANDELTISQFLNRVSGSREGRESVSSVLSIHGGGSAEEPSLQIRGRNDNSTTPGRNDPDVRPSSDFAA
ncbi:hypothetical protein K0M31_010600 [Melipona bicolor]|uniref:BHLH domain-containing protein n=1 Tax=Melipona bicolor TaxID=60889 RepID=A0AA40KIE1_9HYME|nr:hypothetical protein K0M31_010600 [Melipona bicolor]